MLKRLQLKNYQCHKDTRIVFDPQITAIVGPSDCGKSAVLRALMWIATNRPRGTGHVRNGTKEASVSIWTDECKVNRTRGSENTYSIGNRDLKAVGSDVPADVSASLRFDEMNFQGQHESPFWFDLTGGEIAKRLNEIVDLQIIDTSIAEIAKRFRKAVVESEVIDKRMSEAAEEIESLSYVSNMDDDFVVVESLAREWDRKKDAAYDLNADVEDWEKAEKQIEQHDKMVSAGSVIVEQGKKSIELKQRADLLRELITSAIKSIRICQRKVPDISSLGELVQGVEEKRNRADMLASLITKCERSEKKLIGFRTELTEAKRDLESRLGGRCPLCGSEKNSEQLLG